MIYYRVILSFCIHPDPDSDLVGRSFVRIAFLFEAFLVGAFLVGAFELAHDFRVLNPGPTFFVVGVMETEVEIGGLKAAGYFVVEICVH